MNNHQKSTFHPLGDFLNPALALLGLGLRKPPIGQKLNFANHPYLCKDLKVINDYPVQLVTLDEVNKSIQKLRKDTNNYQDRQQFYQQLNPCLDELSKIIAIFAQSAPLIARKEQDKRDQDLKSERRFITGSIIGVISIIIGISTLFNG